MASRKEEHRMTSVDVAGFFQVVWGHIADAEAAAGETTERWFKIGGCLLRVRFIGSALVANVSLPLSHLEVAPSKRDADLTLHCWDCSSLGQGFPTAPVNIEAFTPRGEIRGLNDARFNAANETGGRQLSQKDAHLRQAVYCVGAAADIPRFQIAEPIRVILSWFMRANRRQLLHAGAVGTPDGGVLLIGPSGAGKSNTALGCLVSDLSYASDDFCAVSAGGSPMVYSVYSTAKTHERDWDRHPFLTQLAPDLDPERVEKAIYFLNKAAPHKLISSFPLKAILLPRRTGETCELRPIAAAAALRVAAPNTAKLLPDAGAEVVRSLAQLVSAVPCYELALGSRPELIPGVISGLLAQRRAAAR
jgi:hypothetical protein